MTRLAPLLQENGLIVEAMIIAVGGLSDRFQSRSDTLEELTKLQETLDSILTDPYPAIVLLQSLQTINDPYLQVRGYLQLMRYFPFLRMPFALSSGDYSEIHLLIANTQEAAHAIQDASRKEWAFEQLAQISRPIQRQKLLQQAIQFAKQISDFENRARAYTRLANYFSLEEGLKLFLSALDDVKEIRDERKKVETLLLFRQALNRYPQAHLRFQQIVDSLNSWNQAKVFGLNAPLLQQYATDLEEINPETASLILGAILNDLQSQFALPSDLGGLWSGLLSTQKASALAILCQRARKERLLLTQEATATLNQLVREGDVETVSRLLPLVQRPDSRSLPILNDWLVRLDPLLNQYVHLLLAEAGRISEQTLSLLVELLTSSEDQISYRAALALHGPRRLSTSTLGVGMLLQLAQKRIELLANNPTISVVITWTFERIYHNDIQILEAITQLVNSDAVDAEKALIVLKNISWISPNAWTIFLRGLRDGIPEMKDSLLHSLCMLLTRERISDDMWQEALPILKGLDMKRLETYKFVLDAPAKLVESAYLAWEISNGKPYNSSTLALDAERIFFTKQQNMQEVLQEEESNVIKGLLKSVGSLYLVNQAYIDRINSASAFLEEKPQLLEVLIDWLNKMLQDGSSSDNVNRFMICDLLNVVAAGAERLPNTFYKKASASPSLPARLLEVVEWHNTFPGRQSALVLLSYFYCVTEETIAALKVSLRDVVEVQNIALQNIDRYREIDSNSDLLPQLFENLLDPSPAIGYTTARMLVAIARNVYLDPPVREEIIAAFVKAIDDDRSKRDVYLFIKKEVSHNNHVAQIEYKGQLDEIFYEIVTQLSGISNLVQSK